MDEMKNPSDPADHLDLNPTAIEKLDAAAIEMQDDLEGDTLREECGVFGIFGHPEAAAITALGLHALQHRGQEAAGIVSFDGSRFHSERRLGLVGDTFSRREVIERLPGSLAVGHVRYSTTGATILRNVQPLFAELNAGGFAVGHNGNLTNGLSLRRELVRNGAMMQSTTDTEVILHLVAQSKRGRFIDRFIESLRAIEGAYSLVSMTNKKLIGARDPLGIRPLVLGELDGCPILASETCALDMIGAKYVRDIEPGEIIVFDEQGAQSHKPFPPKPPRPCIFEYIYFSRPDSIVGGRSVYDVRKAFGAQLARESHVEVDVVVPVPDSGVPAAVGYSQHSGVPFELGIIRNHYVGRTFIQPTQSVRELGVRMKHSANRAAIEGKRIILIDDSLVRGTTSKKIVRMMRDAGARTKCTSASPRPRSCIPTTTASTCRTAAACWRRPIRWKRCAKPSARIRWRSCRSTACTAPWASPAAIPPIRNSPTTALPASTPPTSPTRPRSSRSRGNCRCWRRRASDRAA